MNTTLDSLLDRLGIPRPSNTTTTTTTTTKKPIKFMLVSTHAQQTTGYSKVSYHIIKELAAHHPYIQVFHFGFQRFFNIGPNYRPYPQEVNVVDPAAEEVANSSLPRESGFGFSQLPAYIRKVKPDVLMIYNDAGVICQFLQNLNEQLQPAERTYKLAIYLDQVYTIQRPDLLAQIDKVTDVYFAFTEFWREILQKQGIRKPIHVLRHGFDADVYKPMDRATMRQKHGIPENLFLMLNINRNTPRKRWDIVVTALAELVARYPTKPIALLAVTDAGEQGGYPIHEIYTRELIKRGVPVQHHLHKLMITKSALNYTDETVNELYSMSDIGVTGAEGEGFGLCQFEAMGVGVPQVVPHVGGFRDFCTAENAVLVKPTHQSYLPYAYSAIGGEIELVTPADLCLGIEELMLDTDLREAKGRAARETVLTYRWSDEVAGLAEVLKNLVNKSG